MWRIGEWFIGGGQTAGLNFTYEPVITYEEQIGTEAPNPQEALRRGSRCFDKPNITVGVATMRLEDFPAQLSTRAVCQVLEAASRIIDSRQISPRGVGDYDFDDAEQGEPSSKPAVQGTNLRPCSALAPFTHLNEEAVIKWVTFVACAFVEDVLGAATAVTQHVYRTRIQPNDVAVGLSVFANSRANFDKYRAFPHGLEDEDEDESSDEAAGDAHESKEDCGDGDGTAGEHESDSDEDLIYDSDSDEYISDDEIDEAAIERMRVRDSNSEAPIFDEAFPNEESVEIIGGKDFVVRVAKSRHGSYLAEVLEESDNVTGIINRALYAFLVAKLSAE